MPSAPLTVGSLFTGVGMFDLGFVAAGYQNNCAIIEGEQVSAAMRQHPAGEQRKGHATMNNSTIPLRRCTKCNVEYLPTLEYFRKKSKRPDGLDSHCRICCRLAANAYNKIKSSDPVYQEKNKLRVAEWKKLNPEKARLNKRVYQSRRRKRIASSPISYTVKDVEIQYKAQNCRCWWCLKPLNGKYDIDHVIPLSRGGTNDPRNIVLACEFCNSSKHNKLPGEWCNRLF